MQRRQAVQWGFIMKMLIFGVESDEESRLRLGWRQVDEAGRWTGDRAGRQVGVRAGRLVDRQADGEWVRDVQENEEMTGS